MIKRAVVQTQRKTEVQDVTPLVADFISVIQDGVAIVYTPHTTASLILSEDDDELRNDIVRVAENLLAACRPFTHIKRNNPNAEAHILSALGGTSVAIAIIDGKLDLGTYQNILLLEMDGPKEREIRVKVIEG
ncbi:MAG: YjbQ family protein [Anaerolineales bacterium]|nr:YjbQ family protein [Anaerolineales bacterium]